MVRTRFYRGRAMMFGLGSGSVLPGASHHGSGLVRTLFYGGGEPEPKLQRPSGCRSGKAAATRGAAAACLWRQRHILQWAPGSLIAVAGSIVIE